MIDQDTGEILGLAAAAEIESNPDLGGHVPVAPFLRTPYNYNRDAASIASGLSTPEPTKAQQQFAEESDINVIVKRFGLTGQLPENVRMPTFGDFEGITDFHTAANALRAAQESFDAMPAEVRYRFANDPGRFVEFVNDPGNLQEAEKLGLVHPARTLERARAAQAALEATGQGVPPAPAPAAPPTPVVPTGVVPK